MMEVGKLAGFQRGGDFRGDFLFALLVAIGGGGEDNLVEGRRGLVRQLVGQDTYELDEKHGHQHQTRRQRRKAVGAAFLVLQVEQHDDEKEQHHDRAGIDEDLITPTKKAESPMKIAASPTKDVTIARALETGFRNAITATAPMSMMVAKSQNK